MKKILILLAIIALLIVVVLQTRTPVPPAPTPVNTTDTIPSGMPTFTWQYSPLLDPDFPKTRITLTATYPNGTTTSKDIDTPDGSCNEYSEPDVDVYDQSTMIICYAAGLGHYYKVVEKGGAYLVMRKTFEEGSPEYNPPQQQFQTIATF